MYNSNLLSPWQTVPQAANMGENTFMKEFAKQNKA
jgi:hypothetical protein